MKKIIFLFCLLLCSFTFAQDTQVIEAEGVAGLSGDLAAARDKAIEDALRRAVEQAVGTIVESETAVENYQLLSDKIYSRSSGYVKNYKIVSENQGGGLLRVKVSAEVSSGDLNNELSAIGVLQRRMKYPRVMVMIAEDSILSTNTWNAYTVSTSQAESTVIARLKEKGFNVVDQRQQRKQVSSKDAAMAGGGDYSTAGRIGKKLGSEIVIVGTANSTRASENIAGSQLLSVSTAITASAVKSGSGEVIAQASSQGTAAHINEIAALQQSLQKASDQVAEDLIDGILEAWKRETSGTRNLALEFHDVSAAELDKLKDALAGMYGVADVVVRNFSSGDADISIQAKTDALELSKSIGKAKFSGFKLVLVDSSIDHLEYKVVH